jgi:hypothetical protein
LQESSLNKLPKATEGNWLGAADWVGWELGADDGLNEGSSLGIMLGIEVGTFEGLELGAFEGLTEKLGWILGM